MACKIAQIIQLLLTISKSKKVSFDKIKDNLYKDIKKGILKKENLQVKKPFISYHFVSFVSLCFREIILKTRKAMIKSENLPKLRNKRG